MHFRQHFLLVIFISTFIPSFYLSTVANKSYIAAEWEFLRKPWKNNNSRLFKNRNNAAYWSTNDNNIWYLFGGNINEKNYSDLWKINSSTLSWERIYPRNTVRSMLSPENISNPIICGHLTTLAVYGPQVKSNTVWIFETNDTLWTSYICTESLNSKHTFCPNFNNTNPIAWCDTRNAAIFTLVPNANTLQLWKFSLLTPRWEHILQGQNNKLLFSTNNSTIYTSCDGLLYVILIDKNDSLVRHVYRYPTSNFTVEYLGPIKLNSDPLRNNNKNKILINAVKSNKNNNIYLIVAYEQLVDIWLLNRTDKYWILMENIWKGSSLKWYQTVSATSGLYYLQIDGSFVLLTNPNTIENEQEQQGIFKIKIVTAHGDTELVGVMSEETPAVPTSDSIMTTTEWNAELIMEGFNITSTINLTEVVSTVKNDRNLLALEVNSDYNHHYQKSFNSLIFFVSLFLLVSVVSILFLIYKYVKFRTRNVRNNICEPPPFRYSVIPDDLTYSTYPGA